MTTVNPTSGNGVLISQKGEGGQSLGQSEFLRLMTAQLKQQDPFNPMDNTAMVAQMAQFSSVAGIGEINTSLSGIAERLDTQTALLRNLQPLSPSS
jgi:flagellar basal-body rod modification protein FlgD